MNYTAEGAIQEIFDTEQKSDKFSSREFVLRIETNNPQYPNYVKFQLINDRCDLIEPYSEDDEVRVHFDIVGKKWQDKYFTNLTAWKIERTAQEVSRTEPKPKEKKSDKVDPTPPDDDLPF